MKHAMPCAASRVAPVRDSAAVSASSWSPRLVPGERRSRVLISPRARVGPAASWRAADSASAVRSSSRTTRRDQPPFRRLVRLEDALPEVQLGRPAHAHQAGQEPGAAAVTGQPQPGEPGGELGALGGQDEVGDVDQAEAAARHGAVHGRDDRDRRGGPGAAGPRGSWW